MTNYINELYLHELESGRLTLESDPDNRDTLANSTAPALIWFTSPPAPHFFTGCALEWP